MTWTCASAVATYNLKEGEEEMISYLPVSHIVAQVMMIVMMMMIIVMILMIINDDSNTSCLRLLTSGWSPVSAAPSTLQTRMRSRDPS